MGEPLFERVAASVHHGLTPLEVSCFEGSVAAASKPNPVRREKVSAN